MCLIMLAPSFPAHVEKKDGLFPKAQILGCWSTRAQDSQEPLQRIVRGRRKLIIISIYQIYLCARHWAQRLFNSQNTPKRWCCYYPHFTDKETEVQRVR